MIGGINEPPMIKRDDTIDEASNTRVVRSDDHRFCLRRARVRSAATTDAPALAVEARGGFVGENDPRIEKQGAGDRHALLLAARQQATVCFRRRGHPSDQAELRRAPAMALRRVENQPIVSTLSSGVSSSTR